jgi:hypothetical protein
MVWGKPLAAPRRAGAAAEAIIAALPDLVVSYPYTDRYNIWPGPNSHTFTAYLARHLPELLPHASS